MNYRILYVLVCIAGICSCGKSDKFVLQGELSGYPHNEIWVIYDDPVSKLDTIYPREGKFIYEIMPDTTTLFRLLTPDMQVIPIVAEKGDKMNVEGDINHPVIQTKGANKVYADFLESVKGLDEQKAAAKAEEVIRTNPQSFISAYLIDKYFIQQAHPDAKKINKLMAPLDGKVKDSRVLTVFSKAVQAEKDKPSSGAEYLGYFSYRDREKKYISWTLAEGSYVLVNLWASWDKASVQAVDSIRKVAEKLPEGKFKVINISLDYDKKTWLNACKDDDKKWTEVCDFKGWNTVAVQQRKIYALPANVLIDQNRRIVAKNLFDRALYDKVKQLIEKKP